MDSAHYTVTTPYAQPLRQAFHKRPTKDLCVHSAIYFNPVLLQKVHCNTQNKPGGAGLRTVYTVNTE